MKQNKPIPRQILLPLTETDWQRTFQSVRDSYIRDRRDQPALKFFCRGAAHHDGHLLVVGQGSEPLYVVVVALGPLVAHSLADFFLSNANDFFEINCWGDALTEWSWGAAGALAAAKSLPRDERQMLVSLIGALIDELKDQFHKLRMNN